MSVLIYPSPRFAWPIVIASGQVAQAVTFNAGGGPSEIDFTITAQTYNTPELLCAAIVAALGTVHAGVTLSLSIASNGRPQLVVNGLAAGATLKIGDSLAISSGDLWALLGFKPGTTYTATGIDGLTPIVVNGDNQCTNMWLPGTLPQMDSGQQFAGARSLVLTDDSAQLVDWGTLVKRQVGFTKVQASKLWVAFEGTDYPLEAFQRLFLSATTPPSTISGTVSSYAGSPGLFQYAPDSSDPSHDPYLDDGNAAWWSLEEDTANKLEAARPVSGRRWFDFSLILRKAPAPA